MMVKNITMMIMTTMLDHDSNHCNGDKYDGDLVIMTFDLSRPYHTTAKTEEYTILVFTKSVDSNFRAF